MSLSYLCSPLWEHRLADSETYCYVRFVPYKFKIIHANYTYTLLAANLS